MTESTALALISKRADEGIGSVAANAAAAAAAAAIILMSMTTFPWRGPREYLLARQWHDGSVDAISVTLATQRWSDCLIGVATRRDAALAAR